MPEQKASKDMKIKVTGCRQMYAGTNPRGDNYTIYEIAAENAQGQRINQKLRSFGALPIGQVVDVTVTPFDSEKHGRSYTIAPRGRRGTNTTEQLNEMRAEIDSLRQGVQHLMERVKLLEAGVTNRPGPLPSNGAAPVDGAALDEKFGATAPW